MANSIGQTIADQIGARAFFMMGAKNLVSTENGLNFKVGRNAKKVTHVCITLNPLDLYDIEFVRCNTRAKEMRKTISETPLVHVDCLHTVLTAGTGLDTHL